MSRTQGDLTLTARTTEAGGVRVGACKLVQTSGTQQGRQFEILRPSVVVGASGQCDLTVDDPTVSRRHFEIARAGQGYVLRDLDSTNGVLLDGTRIKEAELVPGAVIRAGDVFFSFEPILPDSDIVPSDASAFGDIHGQSYAMRTMFTVLERVASTDVTILLHGETGTGKSALARAIHQASARRDEPFLVVDCGAITPTLVESELFGHEKGSFTGAVRERRGAFELAGSGTLFIDELTELAPHLQPKLLRALEERSITRVGSHVPIPTACRVIAATQHDLWAEVEKGRFRTDLYFRLAVVTIPMPPLRERRDDLPLLVDHFLGQIPDAEYDSFNSLNPELQRKLLAHDWPGNIRELRNTIQRISLMYSQNPFVGRRASGPVGAAPPKGGGTFTTDMTQDFKQAKDQLLAAFEREYITRLMERCDGNVTQAARQAGLDRKHIYNLMTKHGITGAKE